MNQETIDAAVATAAAKATVGAGVGGAVALWSGVDWLGLLGLAIAVASLVLTWFYKRKEDRRKERAYQLVAQRAHDDHEESLQRRAQAEERHRALMLAGIEDDEE